MASETTRLLVRGVVPSSKDDTSNETHVKAAVTTPCPRRSPVRRTVVGVVLVVAVAGMAATLRIASSAARRISTAKGSTTTGITIPTPVAANSATIGDNGSYSSGRSSRASVDATMALWEAWKAELLPRDDEDAIADVSQFLQCVRSWWTTDNDSDHDDNSHIGINNNERRQVQIQDAFESWWAHASAEERQWWNATIRTVRHDAATVQHETVQWEHGAVQSLHNASATEQAWQHKAQERMHHDAAVVAQKEHAVRDGVHHATEGWTAHEQQWVNATDQTLHHDTAALAAREHALIQGTKAQLQHDRDVIQHAEHGFLEALHRDEDAVVRGERAAWNTTQRTVVRDVGQTERAFEGWWHTTRTVADHTWNTTVTDEAEWWNATHDWFFRHVHGNDPSAWSTDSNDPATAASSEQPLALYLNTSRSFSLLMNGYRWYDFSADYFALQQGLDVQLNQAYCAVASAAAVLNSFRGWLPLPVDPAYDPHPYATQRSLVMSNNDCVARTVTADTSDDSLLTAPGGLSLTRTGALLRCHVPDSWNVTVQLVDPNVVSLATVRRALSRALSDPTQRVLVNYDRRVLLQHDTIGGDGGGSSSDGSTDNDTATTAVVSGHVSPLGSYSDREDAFLILDVAKYKYPPVWIKAQLLYNAMVTMDGCGSMRDDPGYESANNTSSSYSKDSADSKDDATTPMVEDHNISESSSVAHNGHSPHQHGKHTNSSSSDQRNRSIRSNNDTEPPTGPPSAKEEYLAKLQQLGCRPQYRGYLIVGAPKS